MSEIEQEECLSHSVQRAKNPYSNIVAFFMLVLLGIFPLYFHNYYFDIMVSKYNFYYRSVLCMAGIVIVVGLRRFYSSHKNDKGNKKFISSKLCYSSIKSKLNIIDVCLLIFLLFVAISTIQSDYLYESFWGNEGRFSGLFLLILYGVSVFLIGKLAKITQWHLDVFLFSGVLVCLFGITDYFRMDLFHWKTMADPGQRDFFTSTMGNINTYTAYVAMVMGVSSALFSVEKNKIRLSWYFLVTTIAFAAIIMGQSDNAYLAMGALFGFLPFYLFQTRRGVKRYVLLVVCFISVVKIIDIINDKMLGKVIGLSGVFKIFADYSKLTNIVIAIWCLIAVLYMGDYLLFRDKEDKIGNLLRVIWGAGLCALVIAILFVLYDANIAGHAEKYEKLSQYLVFNDDWGTNRGYCWRIGWESYLKQPLRHKLFGFGPDTFGILTWDYREEAIRLHGVIYENAHNEYLQYLVTIGIFGVLSYLAFLGSFCIRMIKHLKQQPWALAPLMAVLCYAAQAAVNINLPIATPLMWTLLAMGVAICRKSDSEKDEK